MKSRTGEFDLTESIFLQSMCNPYKTGGVSFCRYQLIHERNEFYVGDGHFYDVIRHHQYSNE